MEMMIRPLLLMTVVLLGICLLVDAHGDHDHEHEHEHEHDHSHHEHDDDDVQESTTKTSDLPKLDPEEVEYHKGSLCGYCEYCKFCKLCDRDCPCEVGPGKPNCHMCKYCKYCYMCKVCDTICQPGGVIDRVTSKIFSAIPRYNKEEIDKDIDGVKTWIEKTKEEL